jgi:hypothetical protein
MPTLFCSEDPKKRFYLGDIAVDRRIILKFIFEKRCQGMNRMQLSEDKVQYWLLLNPVMDILVLQKKRSYHLSIITTNISTKTLRKYKEK